MDGTDYPKKKAKPVDSWGEKVTTEPPIQKATEVADWGEEVVVTDEPVKKKEDGVLSGIGSLVGSGAGEVGPSEENVTEGGVKSIFGKAAASIGAPAKQKLPDHYQKLKEEALAELNLTEEEVNRSAPVVSSKLEVTVDGDNYAISPNRLPSTYEKTLEGARRYAIDMAAKMRDPAVSNEDKNAGKLELLKVSDLTTYDGKKDHLTGGDLAEINKILGKNYDQVTPDVIQELRDKKSAVLSKIPGAVAPGIPYKFDSLIKKASDAIQVEVEGRGALTSMGADTRSDLRAIFTGVKGNVENIVGRINVENITNPFMTGLEAMKYDDPNQYEIIKRRLREGGSISTIKAAELTNRGAKIIDAHNIKLLSEDKIDIKEYYEKRQEVGKVVENTFYSHPDILQSAVAEVIAKHYDKSGTIAFGKWFVSDKEIDGVPKEEFEAAGIDFTRPEVQAAIKNIKKNEGILPFDNAVRKDALIRELGRGFLQPIKGTGEFVKGLATSDDEKRIEAELAPLTDYEKQRGEYFNKRYGGIADAFNGAGQFVSQYLLMEGAIGALKVGGVTSAAVRQRAGQMMVPFIQSYDQYHKDALLKTDDPLAAKATAFINAAMESISEQVFDNVKFGRQVVSDFSKSATNFKNVANIFKKGITTETRGELQNAIKEGIENSIRTVSKGVAGLAKESFEEVPVAASNFITDALLDPKSVENREMLPELKDAFLAGMVSFSIPSLIGVSGRLRQQFKNPQTQNDALMIAARNRESVSDAIYSQLEDGELDQDEANERLKILNSAEVSLGQIPVNNKSGEKLSEAERVRYLSLDVKEKYLREQNKALETGDPIVASNDETIKALRQQKADIIDRKPETGKTDDDRLLDKIRVNGLISNEEFQEDIQYFVDKTGEAPAQAMERFGENEAKELLARVPTEKLKENYSLLEKLDPTSPDAIAIEEELIKREKAAAEQDKTATVLSEINTKAAQVGQEISPILQRINDADYINENELNQSADKLYDILDAVDKSSMTEEQKESSRNLIEPLIQKMEGYEFRTKTQTSTVTEKTASLVPRKTVERKKEPALRQSEGSAVTVTRPNGTQVNGILRNEGGKYYVINEDGNKESVFGEVAINDRDLSLPSVEEAENPIELDQDGNVASITLKTKDGSLVKIRTPDKALDLAIQLRAEMIGEVPQPMFDLVFDEVQKEIQQEVLVNEGSATASPINQNQNAVQEQSLNFSSLLDGMDEDVLRLKQNITSIDVEKLLRKMEAEGKIKIEC